MGEREEARELGKEARAQAHHHSPLNRNDTPLRSTKRLPERRRLLRSTVFLKGEISCWSREVEKARWRKGGGRRVRKERSSSRQGFGSCVDRSQGLSERGFMLGPVRDDAPVLSRW